MIIDAPCADKDVMIQTKDFQSQDARRNFCDLAQIPLP
jgi:hypothetical protein